MDLKWRSLIDLWKQGMGVREISRRTFLALFIVIALAMGHVVTMMPMGKLYHDGIDMLSGFLLLLLPLVWWRVPRLFTVVLHAVMAVAMLMVLYSATYTGGLYSPTMVWLSILTVPVLMLRGPGVALWWVGVIELNTVGMMLATHYGWIKTQANTSISGVPWAFFNQVLAMCNLLFAVTLYHRLHATQMKELRARNRELHTTHRALTQAQAHKDEFVAAVGHELRTPMNAILGFNSVLRAELADRPDQVEVVDHIRRSTGHLLQVINQILEFSQLQAGKVQLAPEDFDLHAVLRGVMAKHQDAALGKGLNAHLRMSPDLPQRVHMDPVRLGQTLGLLLDNAIKFTTNGHVKLVASLAGPCLRFEVSDTGCGIALDRQDHIFRRFEHADVQTNRTHGGTGLGLTICQQLVRLHEGRIGLASEPGKGATFWLELPWQAALPEGAIPEGEPSLSLSMPRHILVVDDNKVNLAVAKLQLQKLWPEARVETTCSPMQALQLLEAQNFDLALIDIVMPEMDGKVLSQQIRQRFPGIAARMPIIALTANSHAEQREHCLQAGMDDVLHKPMDTDELVQALKRHLGRRKEAA